MKIRIDTLAARVAMLSVAVVALSVPAVAAQAATVVARPGALVTHSPRGSCVAAALLAAKDRQVLATPPHLDDAIGIMLNHRHAPCSAFVDYLKQTSA